MVINFAKFVTTPGQNLCVNFAVNPDYPHFKAIPSLTVSFQIHLVVALFSVLAKPDLGCQYSRQVFR